MGPSNTGQGQHKNIKKDISARVRESNFQINLLPHFCVKTMQRDRGYEAMEVLHLLQRFIGEKTMNP
jgi:hypothetical protein